MPDPAPFATKSPIAEASGETDGGRLVGLIFPATGATAALLVGGLTVMERQARTLRGLGAQRLVVVDPEPLTVLPAGAEMARAAQLADLVAPGDRVIAVASGLIVDVRAMAAMLATPAPALLVRQGGAADYVERLDAATLAAGVMILPGAMVRVVAADIGEWDLASTLLRTAAVAPTTTRLDLDTLPCDDPALERTQPMLWVRPSDAATAQAATRAVVAAAQPGVVDWPARWLHPPVEDALARWLAPSRVTPDMVIAAAAVLGVAAAVAMVSGALWIGLAIVLLSGPLEGLAAKLARTRGTAPRPARQMRRLGAVMAALWVSGLAWHFAGSMGVVAAGAIAALVLVPALASAVQRDAFARWTGTNIDSAGTVERRIRLFAASRNTLAWGWLPFAVLGLWHEGYVAMAVACIVSAALRQWRFTARLDGIFALARQQVATNRQ
ncbi:hypothetical protein [Polymorphobacter fuscus]|uniref:Uncharacterized protein n=1 Tax=Sandarakinorhabdus fusca TaxID=1439888 RepID=A0A7C9LEH8_9SPHN|nr:hypothetical protein [Polymorphobacter fuscus]KAB7648410.1 hypothetical protein F9290_01440 [Polymorphobacter fuscus]MQT15927.1 hypothetical protein [Polymorphobacter fuscus]NJC07797.1 hypothetical protein [Polymorphobacter fuscus]